MPQNSLICLPTFKLSSTCMMLNFLIILFVDRLSFIIRDISGCIHCISLSMRASNNSTKSFGLTLRRLSKLWQVAFKFVPSCSRGCASCFQGCVKFQASISFATQPLVHLRQFSIAILLCIYFASMHANILMYQLCENLNFKSYIVWCFARSFLKWIQSAFLI